MPHPERQCLQALPLFCPSPDGSLSPPLCPFLPSCRLPSLHPFSLSPPRCPPSLHPFSLSPPLCPPSSHPFFHSPPLCYPSLWAWEWPLLRPRASWRGWRPCLSASVNNLSPPVNSISLNWFGGVAAIRLLCKCHYLHRVSRYRCRDADGLGWLVTYDTRPRAY